MLGAPVSIAGHAGAKLMETGLDGGWIAGDSFSEHLATTFARRVSTFRNSLLQVKPTFVIREFTGNRLSRVFDPVITGSNRKCP